MKKKSAAWYIAATHFITAGFLIPFVALLIVVYAMNYLGMDMSSVPIQILTNVIWLAAVWLGVIYSANYLAKAYEIANAHKIVVLSTSYRAVFAVLFIGGQFVALTGTAATEVNTAVVIIHVLFTIIGTVVFYVASKKYIKQDATVS